MCTCVHVSVHACVCTHVHACLQAVRVCTCVLSVLCVQCGCSIYIYMSYTGVVLIIISLLIFQLMTCTNYSINVLCSQVIVHSLRSQNCQLINSGSKASMCLVENLLEDKIDEFTPNLYHIA